MPGRTRAQCRGRDMRALRATGSQGVRAPVDRAYHSMALGETKGCDTGHSGGGQVVVVATGCRGERRGAKFSRRAGPSGGMADAGDSKSPGGNPVRVRLSPRALEGTTSRARTRPTMQRLPELKPTPVRPRHPLIYGAGFFLFIAMAGFIGRIGMMWVLSATTLAVVMAIGAIAIAVRAR